MAPPLNCCHMQYARFDDQERRILELEILLLPKMPTGK
jgi:hypothetical protein